MKCFPRLFQIALVFSLYNVSLFTITRALEVDLERIVYPPDDTKYVGTKCVTTAGVNGICRQLPDCVYNEKEIKPNDLCSFEHDEPVYCCALTDKVFNADVRFGDDNTTTTEPSGGNKTNSQVKTIRPVDKICNRYYFNKNDESQKTNESNSSQLAEMLRSQMVTIGWRNDTGKTEWKCSGTLITKTLIITDAKCLGFKKVSPNVVKMSMLSEDDQSYSIRNVYIHPDYRPSEVYHNIALLEADEKFGNLSQTTPACLSTSIEFPNKNLSRVGFLDDRMTQIYVKNLTWISNDNCLKTVGNHLEIPKGVTPELFCGQIKGNCQNESIVSAIDFSTELDKPVIVGVSPSSIYCKESSILVYTHLSVYLDWIEPLLLIETFISSTLVIYDPTHDI